MEEQMSKLAFLGTGLIGAGLAEAAATRGDDVVVWNRTLARARPLAEFGIRVAETPAEAVEGADRVHLALPHDEAVADVIDLFRETLDADTVLVDHTTASPTKTAERAHSLAASEIRYLHAPVMMSPAHCRAASGMMLVSGPEDVYGEVADGLSEMTGRVRYFGEDMRRAAAFKLFGNAMIVSLIGGLADVFAMASELDIGPPEALAFFDDFDPGAVLAYRGKNMSAGNYEPGFELTMARKDVRLMLEAAGDRPLSVIEGLAARMDELIEAGHGRDDLGVLSVESVPES
jgi:3-hydroxyisobutyrate dehydrogenase-like beta-hydroxyacid dehydrogenase